MMIYCLVFHLVDSWKFRLSHFGCHEASYPQMFRILVARGYCIHSLPQNSGPFVFLPLEIFLFFSPTDFRGLCVDHKVLFHVTYLPSQLAEGPVLEGPGPETQAHKSHVFVREIDEIKLLSSSVSTLLCSKVEGGFVSIYPRIPFVCPFS